MTTVELTVHADNLPRLKFLKDNPTLVLKNGKHFKFVYFAPTEEGKSGFTSSSFKDLGVKVYDRLQKSHHWKVVKDITPRVMKNNLLTFLKEIEAYKIREKRVCKPIELGGWLLDIISNGIHTKEETILFVRLLYVHGYSFEEVTQLFSAIVKEIKLSGYFLEEMKRIYKE